MISDFEAKPPSSSNSGADPLYLGTENTIRMTILPVSGSVGFGTSTPDSSYRVDVAGKVNASTGLCIAGDCKTAWSQVGGGGSSQWTTTPSTTNISYSGGNVGVGTSSPIFSMDVNVGVNAFRVKSSSASSGDAIASFENSSGIVGIVRANGNFGIGLPNPGEKLEVSGNLRVSGTNAGNITATGTIEGTNVKAKYQDVAEWVDSSQELAPGTVVVLDRSKSNHVIASAKSYDSRVAGVISLQPGLTLGEGGEGRVLVAATGRVKVKVDAGNGPIEIGDLLVSSDREGFAMKSVPVNIGGVLIHRPGTLIGKALEPLDKGTRGDPGPA